MYYNKFNNLIKIKLFQNIHMESFVSSRFHQLRIRVKPYWKPLKNEKFQKIIKNISGQTLLGYSAKINFVNVQRLQVGLVSNVETLDFLKADGACERFYLQNNLLKMKNSTVLARNRELAHDFWRTYRRLWELAKDSKKTCLDMVPLNNQTDYITFNLNTQPIDLPKEHMISFYRSQYGGGNCGGNGGGGGPNNILIPIFIGAYYYFTTKK
jgi:hypothetical protein